MTDDLIICPGTLYPVAMGQITISERLSYTGCVI